METTDRRRFVAIIQTLCAAFHVDATEPLLEAYWGALADLPIHDVERASTTALRTAKFFPRPAELRETAAPAPDLKIQAQEAWTAIRPFIAKGGRGAPDNLAARVIDMLGGWTAVGTKTPEQNDTWTRRDFLSTYETLAARESNGDRDLEAGEEIAAVDRVASKGLPYPSQAELDERRQAFLRGDHRKDVQADP